MNTPKLPPLPEPDTHCFDDEARKDVFSHSAKQMQAYAIAAIEAQGVPDGVVLQIDAAITQAQKVLSDWNEWYGMHGEKAPLPPGGIVKAQELLAVAKSLLASAPPAPQAKPDRTGMTYYKKDGCKAPSADHQDCICWTPAPQSWPLPGWKVQKKQGNDCEHKWAMDDDHPAHSCCQRCGKVREPQAAVVQQEPLSREEREVVMSSIRDSCDLIHAGVMQQEPVAKVAVSADGKQRTVVPDSLEFFKLADETRLYTHPAQQAKPQPLSDEQKARLFVSLLNAKASGQKEMFDLIVCAVEAAHGIKE